VVTVALVPVRLVVIAAILPEELLLLRVVPVRLAVVSVMLPV
jgi:hypothetical protein